MSRNLILSSASAIAMVLASGVAGAADLPVKYAPAKPVQFVQPFSWSGAYVGGHIGGGSQTTNFQTDSEGCPLACNNVTKRGDSAVYGAQLGWNYQFSNWVVGIEGDASFSNMRAQAQRNLDWCCTSRNSNIDTLVSLRGRLGYAFDRILVYGTGGFAYIHGVARKDTNSQYDGRAEISHYAPVGGLGIAYAFNNNVSVRLEGLRYFMNNKVTTLSDDKSIRSRDISVVRLGLDYKFSSF